jgi:D-3-phosphoglycerate dehydrogenase / 2-oxoglutarate reductase
VSSAVPRLIVAEGNFPDSELERETAGDRAIVEQRSIVTPEAIRAATKDAQGLIVTVQPLGAEYFANLGPDVRVIGRAGIGLDNIDLEEARRRRIAVLNVPGYATAEVATHALALMLALHRRIIDFDAAARTDWSGWRTQHSDVVGLDELILGVVGCGRIGGAVIERARPLVQQVIGFDPLVATWPSGVTRVSSLDELLETSDIVTLHTPLTDTTHHLIGAAQLARMKRNAILINVSRGSLIDEESLVDALEAGTIAAAGLDVLEIEPPPSTSRLLRTPRTVITPHVAWYSTSSERRVRIDALEGVLACLAGQPLHTALYAVPPADAAG